MRKEGVREIRTLFNVKEGEERGLKILTVKKEGEGAKSLNYDRWGAHAL